MKIEMYTQETCLYCDKAKELLKQANPDIEQIFYEVDNEDTMAELQSRAKNGERFETVPQIFFDDEHIGGYEELKAMYDAAPQTFNELLEVHKEHAKHYNLVTKANTELFMKVDELEKDNADLKTQLCQCP